MGLFGRLFKKDPQEELARFQAALSEGSVTEKMLKQAQKLVDHDRRDIGQQATELVTKIKGALAADCFESAKRSEASGNMQDAADWLALALPYLSGAQLEEVQRKIEEIRQAAAEGSRQPLIGHYAPSEGEPESEGEVDFEMHFEMLVGMLTPKIADMYMMQPSTFHEAYVNLNNGLVDEAQALLDALLAERTGEPVILVERARCALIQNEPELARELLEKAWPSLGDEFLDEAQATSVPMLWAEAMLRLEKAPLVVDRLAHLSDPKFKTPALCQLYALALEEAGDLDAARVYLIKAGEVFDHLPNFRFLLARVLEKMGKWQGAIKVLETVAGPNCGGGNCGPRPKHPASMRMLVALYLSKTDHVKEAGDVLLTLEQALEGDLSREDLLLTAMYHEKMGDHEAAEAAKVAASQLKELEGTGLEQGATPGSSGMGKAVL